MASQTSFIPEDFAESERQQLASLAESFYRTTGSRAQYIVRSPGRINLIGDHIDYHGFAVLPMAIENCIWLCCNISNHVPAGGIKKGHLLINNIDPNYPSACLSHSFAHGSQLIDYHNWYNYILCGYHGMLAKRLLQVEPDKLLAATRNISDDAIRLAAADDQLKHLRSLNIVVSSDLPPASGLSSSSALVCASAIATDLLLSRSQEPSESKFNIDALQIAADCAKFEHLIGTQGGGMDQAVIMTAHDGFAKFVQFMPEFDCKNIKLPDDGVWFVSHCGVEYEKASTVGFNSRVLETKFGAAIIAKYHVCRDINIDSSITLGRVKQILYPHMGVPEIIKILRKILHEDPYQFDEICTQLDMSPAELMSKFNVKQDLRETGLESNLMLLQRCEHVFEEADRVERFREVCESTGDIESLGKLMTESHLSLRDKYNCSHPALDKLVEVALRAGAAGARVTGAGWGGCIVTLVEQNHAERVFQKLQEASKFTYRTAPKSGSSLIEL